MLIYRTSLKSIITMAIGKSKISDLNIDSFQNTIDKNIETDQASDKFDCQLRAYTEAGEKLDAARESIDTAKASLNEATSTLQKAVSNVSLAAKRITESASRIQAVTISAKISTTDWNKLSEHRNRIIADERQLLETHQRETKEILSRHFYDMANMMSKREGVWLSNGRVKSLLWIFLLCLLYTVISIGYLIVSFVSK